MVLLYFALVLRVLVGWLVVLDVVLECVVLVVLKKKNRKWKNSSYLIFDRKKTRPRLVEIFFFSFRKKKKSKKGEREKRSICWVFVFGYKRKLGCLVIFCWCPLVSWCPRVLVLCEWIKKYTFSILYIHTPCVVLYLYIKVRVSLYLIFSTLLLFLR